MKKILIGITAFLILACLALFVTTKVSTAHAVARNAVQNSPGVRQNIGSVRHVILTMFSQKTGPTGKGCTTTTYFVLGSSGSEWVHVQLSISGYKGEWKVDNLIEGNQGRQNTDCIYG